MSLSGEDELNIRRAIAEKVAGVPGVGFVIPSPVSFVEKADFFATFDPKLTQKEIETTNIQFCAISFLKFEDVPEEGCEDEPMIALIYNLHVFSEYDFERADESGTPDSFLKGVLKSERAFLNALFAIRQEFLGIQPLDNLPDGYTGETNSVEQQDFAEEKERSRLVGSTDGFFADLTLRVEILISE